MITKKDNISKSIMQFVDMDSLVPDSHLVRKIDASIDFEFIRDLVKDLYSSDNGRPSIDPVVLFKILFIQYLFGIKSMRQTIKEIEVNIAYRWFIGYDLTEPIPHFSTFSKNYERRFTDTNVFQEVFNHILNEINEKGLINKESIFVDSTHIKAYANKRKIENKYIEESYNKYVSTLNEEINEIRKSEGKKPLEIPIKKAIISKTDPDCGMFHKGEKERQLAYSTQVACDENGWIIDSNVYPGNMNDNNSGIDFLDSILEDDEISAVVMDAGYTGAVILNQVLEKGKLPVVPYRRPKGPKSNYLIKPFDRNDYKFDKEMNCYICPYNRILTYRGMNTLGMLQYKSSTKDCKDCPFKKKCTNQKCKEIQRHLLENAKDYAQKIRLSQYGKELYAKRKTTIERCFAITKFNNCLGFTFLRGLKKNKDRCFVIFAMANLKKLASIRYKDALLQLCNLWFSFRKSLFLSFY